MHNEVRDRGALIGKGCCSRCATYAEQFIEFSSPPSIFEDFLQAWRNASWLKMSFRQKHMDEEGNAPVKCFVQHSEKKK